MVINGINSSTGWMGQTRGLEIILKMFADARQMFKILLFGINRIFIALCVHHLQGAGCPYCLSAISLVETGHDLGTGKMHYTDTVQTRQQG